MSSIVSNFARVVVACFVVTIAGGGCATLVVDPSPAGNGTVNNPITFVGGYDARMQTGGVDTKRLQTDLAYAGSGVWYTNTYAVRTGEIEPNLMLTGVAQGFTSTAKGTISDASGDTPLEARSEMGMDWLTRSRRTERFVVGVEIKDGFVGLDSARSNYTLGVTAIIAGIVSPLLLCVTAPCLAYPLIARTDATAQASGVVRVYDRDLGRVVLRQDITATAHAGAQGFHEPEVVFRMLADAVSRRLGEQAALAVATAGY